MVSAPRLLGPLLGLLLAVPGAGQTAPVPAARPAPPRPDLTWAEADSLQKKLDVLEHRPPVRPGARPTAGTVRVTESELNSYLNLAQKALPKGLSDVKVQFLRGDGVFARGLLDLEQVGKRPSTGSMFDPLSLLGGVVPVEVRGRLTSRDGYGTVQVDDVRVGSIPVPASVLQQMVASATRSSRYPAGVDIQAPFRLPYALRRVRIDPPEAILEF
jgi:hypothetical protein